MTSRPALRLLAAVCVLIGVRAVAFAEPSPTSSGHDFFAWYESEVKPRSTGVYEKDGDVVFHYRAPITATGFFREQKSAGPAMAAVDRMVFDWIASNMVAGAGPSGPFAGIPGDWFDRNAEASRAIRGLPVRVAHRGADGDDYVYSMAVARSDLLAEAAKGPFEARPEARERQWKAAVRKSLTAPDRMAFFRDCGALDLWTLLSEQTSGTRAIEWSEKTQAADCRAAVESLRKSAAGAPEPAAPEWISFLGEFPERAEAETNAIPGVAADARVATMLLSFASCPAPSDGPPPDFARMARLLDEPATNTAATAEMAALVAASPGVALPWCLLGDRLLDAGAPHLALASFRNALRADHAGAFALDGLRRGYLALGRPALARGAAALILALAEDGSLFSGAEKTLREGTE